MKDQKEIQIALEIWNLINKLSDLLWNRYEEEFLDEVPGFPSDLDFPLIFHFFLPFSAPPDLSLEHPFGGDGVCSFREQTRHGGSSFVIVFCRGIGGCP